MNPVPALDADTPASGGEILAWPQLYALFERHQWREVNRQFHLRQQALKIILATNSKE